MMYGDESAKFQYAKALQLYQTEKPFVIVSDLEMKDADDRKTNLELEYGDTQLIRDIRNQTKQYSLDANGFCVCIHDWSMEDWYDGSAVQSQYFSEVNALLRREIHGITKIKIFDWRVRRNEPYEHAGVKKVNLADNSQYLLPVRTAHIGKAQLQ
jgi:hypothetical protein